MSEQSVTKHHGAMAPAEQGKALRASSCPVGDMQLRISVNVANTTVNLFKTLFSFAIRFCNLIVVLKCELCRYQPCTITVYEIVSKAEPVHFRERSALLSCPTEVTEYRLP